MIEANDPNIDKIKGALNYIEQKELQNIIKAVKEGTILKGYQIDRLEKLQKKFNKDTDDTRSCKHLFDGQYYIQDISDLSALLNLSERHIFRLIKEGAPAKTDNGFSASAWHLFLSDRSKPKKGRENRALLEEKTIALRGEKAKIAKIERLVMQGKLVDKQQYREAEISRHAELAQEFKSLPNRVSARVANKPAAEAQAIIDSEVKRILKYFENLCLHGREKEKKEKSVKRKVGRPKKVDSTSRKKD